VSLKVVSFEVVSLEPTLRGGSTAMAASETVTAKTRSLARRVEGQHDRQCAERNESAPFRTCKLLHAHVSFLLPLRGMATG
jgi:hypothetical protein